MNRIGASAFLMLMLLALWGWTAPAAMAQTAHFSGIQSTVATFPINPNRVAVDGSGNLYFADPGNNQVMKVPYSNGVYGTATAVVGALNSPEGVAVDASGNNLYICDTGNNKVLRFTLSGGVYAQPTVVLDTSTNVSGAPLSSPQGVAVDSVGTVYISDTVNNRVLKLMPAVGDSYDAPTVVDALAGLSGPVGVAVDGAGTVYIADVGNSRWVKETLSGDTYTATPISTTTNVTGIAVDSKGNVYLSGAGTNMWMVPWTAGAYGTRVSVGSGLTSANGVAVDGNGTVYIADTGHTGIWKETLSGGGNFGSVNVGSPSSSPVSLVFTFDVWGTIAAPKALTQGATGLDFSLAVTGSCTTGNTYNIGDTCTADVSFTPQFAGTRYGAVVLTDNTSNTIATGYVYGTGSGPQVSFLPGTPTAYPYNSLTGLQSVAVDASGNVYVAYAVNSVGKLIGDGLDPAALGGGFQSTYQIAVDGAGNVFVADSAAHRVKEIPLGCAVAGCVVTLGGGFSQPTGVAVDGGGNVFVADNTAVKEIPAGCLSSDCVVGPLGSGFTQPWAVAVDGSGNVFVTDTSNNVQEIVAENGVVSGTSTVKAVGSGFIGPLAVAVDGRGNVFVGELNAVSEILAVGGVVSETSPVIPLGNNFSFPKGVAVDGRGNVYVADSNNTYILEEDLAQAPGVSFATASVGSTSSPQIVTVRNVGNADLSIAVPGAGSSNPSIGVDFTLGNGGSACPVLTSGSSVWAVAAGTSCQFSINFAPLTAGSKAEELILVDNNLNLAGPTQTVHMTGLATIGLSPATLSDGTVGTLFSQQITASGGASSYTYAVTSGTLPTGMSLSSEGVLSGTPMAAGSSNFTITATDSASNTGSQSYSWTIHKGAQTIAFTSSASSLTYGVAPVTLTATGGASSSLVTFSVVSGPASVSDNTLTITGVGTVAVAADQPGDGNYTAAIQVQQTITVATAALTVTPNDVSRSYGVANPAFTGSITGLVAGDVISATYASGANATTAVGVYSTGANSIHSTIVDPDSKLVNYTLTQYLATLTITKATASVTANVATKAYGAVDPSFSGTLTGFLPADNVTPTYSRAPGETVAGGPYAISATLLPSELANYDVTFSTANFTITRAAASVTPNGATKAYGTLDPSFSGTLAGFLVGDNVTASYSRISGETVAGGPYAISATLTPSAALANYNVGSSTASLTITRATPATTWSTPAAILYGTALSGTQLNATSGGLAGVFAYSPAAGTVLSAGNQALSVTFIPTDSTNYSAATAGAKITVTRATALAVVTSSANPVLILNGVTLAVKISLASLVPTGTVTFLDGTTSLGSANLTSGVAVLTTSSLSAGAHSITVVYGGDGNFVATTSAVLTEVGADFTLAATLGNDGGSATVQQGGTAAFSLTFTPANASTWPATVTLSASGLPAGASVTFSPQTLAAGSNTTAVTMTVQVAQTVALLSPDGMRRRLAPIALALLLLPFGAGLRRGSKNLSRMISLCLLAISVAAIAGLSGCGTAKNSPALNPTNYTVTVTATSGALSHTTSVVLTVE